MIEYIQSKNTSIPKERIEVVVASYIMEAQKERINHDLAIAQMCEGTNFLRKRDLLNANNYGDLKKIGSKSTNFQSLQLGIRAHIQQLKGYASLSDPVERLVDRVRFSGIGKNRGKCTTLDDLFPVWVTKDLNKYRNEINTILSEMYSFQESVVTLWDR
jgi:hypothetical protein